MEENLIHTLEFPCNASLILLILLLSRHLWSYEAADEHGSEDINIVPVHKLNLSSLEMDSINMKIQVKETISRKEFHESVELIRDCTGKSLTFFRSINNRYLC